MLIFLLADLIDFWQLLSVVSRKSLKRAPLSRIIRDLSDHAKLKDKLLNPIELSQIWPATIQKDIWRN